MKIELAKHSGFCMGVRNAILRIINEINTVDEDIFVDGPLIHNPQTIEALKKRGLKTLDNLENIDNRQIVVRTHGIPIERNREIKQRSSRLINLTCPRVAKVQAIIKKYSRNGHFTIILGDDDHAEVAGLKSYASSGVFVVSKKSDIKNLPAADKYILVSQTTLDRNLFDEIVKGLKASIKNITVIDTICDSTRLRQADVREGISKGIDTLVVVGGKNSANTSRLAEIGRESKIKSFHIETREELREDDFADSKNVLVTAGASTPGWIINNVLEELYNIKFKKSNFLFKTLKNTLEFIVRTNILSSIFAFFFTLFAQKYAGIEVDHHLALISFFYIFSMYSVNNFFDIDFLKASNSYKYYIYEKFGKLLMALSIVSMVVSIFISLKYDYRVIGLLLFSYLFGFMYFTPPVKYMVRRINSTFIQKAYNSKTVTGFGWPIITVIIPLLGQDVQIFNVLTLSLFIFTLISFRHILIDLIAYQGDLILGRDTLPIWVGISVTAKITFAFSIFTIGAFCLNSIVNHQYVYMIVIFNIIYYLLLQKNIKKVNYLVTLKNEFLVDANFIIMILFYSIISLV